MTKTPPILPPILNVADVALQPQGHGESFVVIAGASPGRRPYPLSAVTRKGAEVDYWDGET